MPISWKRTGSTKICDSIFYINIWNNLDNQTMFASSLNIFKRNLDRLRRSSNMGLLTFCNDVWRPKGPLWLLLVRPRPVRYPVSNRVGSTLRKLISKAQKMIYHTIADATFEKDRCYFLSTGMENRCNCTLFSICADGKQHAFIRYFASLRIKNKCNHMLFSIPKDGK